MKKIHLLRILIITLFGILFFLPVSAEPQKETEKVAVVNGSVISKHDFDVSFNSYVNEISTKTQRALTDDELDQMKGNVLERLIEQKLLYQAAIKQNTQIDEEEYQKNIGALDEQLKAHPEFKSEVEKTQYSMEDIHNQIRENMIITSYVNKTFFSTATVSEAEVKAYYEKNKAQFELPEKISAQHILIKPTPPDNQETRAEALKKIKKIQEALKTNPDFEGLAKEFSQCPSSKKGGDLGFFSRGQMVPPFENAAFALGINEISDVVETQFGYHLIKVTGKVAAKTIVFDQVKDQLKASLTKQKAMEDLGRFIDEAKKSGTIQLLLN